MQSFNEFADEMRPHHNEICLVHGNDLVRLIGVGADDHDHYYIVQDPAQRRRAHPFVEGDPSIVWSSAVGHIQPLKDTMPADAYVRLEAAQTRGGCVATEDFAVEDQGIWDHEASSLDRHISRCRRFAITFDRDRPQDRFALWRCYPDTDQADALILNGELAKLEGLAIQMVREMTEYAELREED